MSWRAGPERPRTRFCWDCSRRLHGRVHARVVGEDGQEHDVHKACVNGRTMVGGSTTLKPTSGGNVGEGRSFNQQRKPPG